MREGGGFGAAALVAALRQETGGCTLEGAFIALTDHSIRKAEAVPIMRMMRRMWIGGR